MRVLSLLNLCKKIACASVGARNASPGTQNQIFENLNNGTLISSEENDIVKFSVAPNPNNGTFKIIFDSNEALPKTITVTDLLDKEILSIKNPDSSTFPINLGNVSNGMFILKVNYEAKTVSKRTIKE